MSYFNYSYKYITRIAKYIIMYKYTIMIRRSLATPSTIGLHTKSLRLFPTVCNVCLRRQLHVRPVLGVRFLTDELLTVVSSSLFVQNGHTPFLWFSSLTCRQLSRINSREDTTRYLCTVRMTTTGNITSTNTCTRSLSLDDTLTARLSHPVRSVACKQVSVITRPIKSSAPVRQLQSNLIADC